MYKIKICLIKGNALKAILLMCSVSHLQLFVNPLTVACQAPLSMEFSMQKYWSGLPFPTPWFFPAPESNPHHLHLLHWQGNSLPLCHLGSPAALSLYLGDRCTERNDLSPTALKIVQSRAYFPPCGRECRWASLSISSCTLTPQFLIYLITVH